MCTLTYLPFENGTYMVGHSRDELEVRHATFLRRRADPRMIYPEDPVGKGSWIAASEERSVAIINGSRGPHVRRPPYSKSRGLVLLDAAAFEGVLRFATEYDFKELEPFTMVVVESHALFELHWDGKLIDLVELQQDQPHIWASWTLYDAYWQQQRRDWMMTSLNQSALTNEDDLVHFHMTAGIGDKANDIFMKRPNGIRTCSITTISHSPEQVSMTFRSTIANHVETLTLE